MNMCNGTLTSVMALALFTGVSAQTTTAATRSTPTQEQSQLVRSHYDACLLTANTSTWEALGLNSDQMTRIAEVQSRYRTYVQPPKEEPKAKQKGRKAKTVKGKEKAAQAQAPAQPLEKEVVKDAASTASTDAIEQTLETADLDNAALSAQPESFDEELRGILTPEQWAMWDKRCVETSMK